MCIVALDSVISLGYLCFPFNPTGKAPPSRGRSVKKKKKGKKSKFSWEPFVRCARKKKEQEGKKSLGQLCNVACATRSDMQSSLCYSVRYAWQPVPLGQICDAAIRSVHAVQPVPLGQLCNVAYATWSVMHGSLCHSDMQCGLRHSVRYAMQPVPLGQICSHLCCFALYRLACE